jgi:hypothetical protein
MDPLQLFLSINIFIIGALTALALQYAYAHFKPHQPKEHPHPIKQTVSLSPAMREHLIQQAQTNFQSVLNRSANELGHDLKSTTIELNKELEKLGDQIINDEMKRYQADLEKLRQAAEATISGAETEIATHQTDLKAKLAEEIALEKERMIKQIDTKLADGVMSFLMETLQHNIDLGTQSPYLIAMLEEHKAELAKGISSEA